MTAVRTNRTPAAVPHHPCRIRIKLCSLRRLSFFPLWFVLLWLVVCVGVVVVVVVVVLLSENTKRENEPEKKRRKRKKAPK